jgi:cell division protein ZapE
MQVNEMNGLVDHRLRQQPQSTAYFEQGQRGATAAMWKHFIVACDNHYRQGGSVAIEQRQIACEYQVENAIWFEFDQLCKGPRSQNDYIALANRYRQVYIANVPQMGGALTDRNIAQGTEDNACGSDLAQLNDVRQQILLSESKSDDEARRFITLVDEFYDHNVKLYLSAEVPIIELYLTGRVQFEFARTISRLIEMQSQAYLGLD